MSSRGRLSQGRKTLIYTLVEAAGARAREFIQARTAGADVVVMSPNPTRIGA